MYLDDLARRRGLQAGELLKEKVSTDSTREMCVGLCGQWNLSLVVTLYDSTEPLCGDMCLCVSVGGSYACVLSPVVVTMVIGLSNAVSVCV